MHTFHGHVLRGYFSRAKTEALPPARAPPRAKSTDALIAVSPEVRDDLVRARHRAASEDRRHPARTRPRGAHCCSPDARERRCGATLGIPDGRLRRRLARSDDGDQASRRPAARVRATCAGPDAHLLARRRRAAARASSSRSRASSAVAAACTSSASASDVGAIYAACDAIALTSANEGTPVTAHRGAGRGRAGRLDRRRRRRATSSTTDGRASLVAAGRHRRDRGRAASDSRTIRALRERIGEAGGRRVRERYSVPRLVARHRRALPRAARRGRRRARAADALARGRLAVERAHRRAPRDPLRIVLVSQYFPPEIGATQSRMQAFAEYLAERGHTVTVIAEFPNHPLGVMPPRVPRPHRRGRPVEPVSRPARLGARRAPRRRRSRGSPSTLVHGARDCGRAACRPGGRRRRDDAAALHRGRGLGDRARSTRAPFVLDVRDLWPAAATSLNQISPGWVDARRRGARAAALPIGRRRSLP